VLQLESSRLPLQRVREAVQNQILPKYLSVLGVHADYPQEKIVEQLHATVNELAQSVTAKLQELLPSADVRDPRAVQPEQRESSARGPRAQPEQRESSSRGPRALQSDHRASRGR
jgi:hypothetical protein